VSKLRSPSVIQYDGITTHLYGVRGSPLAGVVFRNRDQALRSWPEVGTGLPTEKRDKLFGNTNVNKHHAIYRFEGHKHIILQA